jgi:hypothetical protein
MNISGTHGLLLFGGIKRFETESGKQNLYDLDAKVVERVVAGQNSDEYRASSWGRVAFVLDNKNGRHLDVYRDDIAQEEASGGSAIHPATNKRFAYAPEPELNAYVAKRIMEMNGGAAKNGLVRLSGLLSGLKQKVGF